jgi:multiple sugar transport system permease protein
MTRGVRERTWFWFVAPALILLLAFQVIPILVSFAVSFAEYNPILGDSPRWVGTANYRVLFDASNEEVWLSFGRTVALTVLSVSLETALGLFLALLLRRDFRGRGFATALLLLPMMLSPAVVGSFWRYLFNTDYGALNWLLDQRLAWSGSNPMSFLAVLIVEVWSWTPFMMLLSLAALNAIPPQLYEAAEVDQAGAWFRLRRITLPLAAPLLLLGILFRSIDAFRLFDTAMVLNGSLEGQPTTFLSVLIYGRAFGGSRSLGEPAALACLLLLMALILAFAVLRLLDRARREKTA